MGLFKKIFDSIIGRDDARLKRKNIAFGSNFDKDININYIQSAINSVREIFDIINISITKNHLDFLKSNSISIKIPPSSDILEQASLSVSSDLPLPSIDEILSVSKIEDAFLPFQETNTEISEMGYNLFMSFFSGTEKGYHYLNPNVIELTMGNNINNAYPGASDVFIRFAESVWTFKLLCNELVISHRDLNITQLFIWLEFNVSAIFFPARGGHPQITLKHRIDVQRDLLQKVGFEKIDEFIYGNPLLRL